MHGASFAHLGLPGILFACVAALVAGCVALLGQSLLSGRHVFLRPCVDSVWNGLALG